MPQGSGAVRPTNGLYLYLLLYTTLLYKQQENNWTKSCVCLNIPCLFFCKKIGFFCQILRFYFPGSFAVRVCFEPRMSPLLNMFRRCNDVANSKEQSPSWEANRSSAGQEIPCILLNLKFHYPNYKSSPLVSVLSQINPAYDPSHFLKVCFNIIFPSTLTLPSGHFPSDLPTKTLYAPIVTLIRATCPTHLILLDWCS